MNITTIIVAIIGGLGGICAGIVSILKFISERIDLKKQQNIKNILNEQLIPLKNDVHKILEHNCEQDHELREIRLDTLRTQMYFKMEHRPKSHDTILKIAFRYFVEYHGDWIATIDFLEWAEREHIKVPKSILDAISKIESEK